MTNVVVRPLETRVTVDEQTNEIVVTAFGPQGPQGVQGPEGQRGEKGETGDVAALVYVHDQAVAASTWNINHGKGYYLQVTVVDSAGTQVEGNVVFQDSNTIVIEFASSFAGKAYLS